MSIKHNANIYSIDGLWDYSYLITPAFKALEGTLLKIGEELGFDIKKFKHRVGLIFKEAARTFIQVLALLLVVMSSYFLIKGVLLSSPKIISDLVSTRLGYSLPLAQDFCHQRADYIVGFVLLLSGSILQGANLLWAYRIKDFGVNKAGMIIAIIVAAVIFIIAHNISSHLYETSYNKVESVLKESE